MSILRLIILALCILGINSFSIAQADSTSVLKADSVKYSLIDFDITIKVDDSIPQDNLSILEIFNTKTNKVDVLDKIDGHFILKLEYNIIYGISIGRKNTNTKTIIIDTNAPYDNWVIISGVNLTTKEKGEKKIVGSISYDEATKTFVKKAL